MIEVDFHVHTLASGCGLHTILEMLEEAKKKGMKGVAITDHGTEVGGRVNSVFWERLNEPVDGIVFLKGLESNLKQKKGEIDFPVQFLQFADIVLLGIHGNIKKGLGKKIYTEMLIAAIQKNPYVDIITHPNDPTYEADYMILAETARDYGIALEFNNSKLLLNRVSQKSTENMIKACLKTGCKIILCSDAHALKELGRDDFLQPVLKKLNVPDELIINSSVKKAFGFIEERKKIKKQFIKKIS